MKEKIENERFLLLQRQISFLSSANLLAGLGLIAMLWDIIPQKQLLIWYGLMLLFWGLRGLHHFFQKTHLYQAAFTEPNIKVYYIFPIISGAFWGGAGVLFYTPESTAHLVYLIMFQFGLIAGAAITLAYLRWAFVLFAFTTVIPLSLLLILERDWHYFWMALTLLFSMLIMLGLSRNLYHSITDSLLIRFKNESLVEKLQSQALELKAQKEKAVKANEDKSRFLASASHDLRQPIHSLSLLTDALDSQVSTETGKSILKLVRSANRSLYGLLNSLLDISKLDAGIVKPEIERIALAPLLHQLVDNYRTIAEKKGLQLRFKVRDCYVDSDSTLLSSAIMNLLDNAVKYTPKGSILVAMRLYKKQVKVQIWDTGIGIEEDNREIIFDEFLQLGNPERDSEKGLGLGLSISKRILRLLGYPLSLCSTVNKGSVFSITMPLSVLPEKSQQTQHYGSVNLHPCIGSGQTILVIDDNQAVLDATKLVLNSWGYTVKTATCIEEVRTIAINNEVIDLIATDYRLRENTTGIDAIKVFEQLSGHVDIPAFLITGDTDPDKIQEASSFGIPLLHKPLKQGELKMILRHFQII
ncbi:MAG: hybrid sensor histidine kinase/response regulator [Cocleimonas sp.]|nr:hybrid sensor histidine kinase/response regulator [Cocleimonas sp.]